MFLNKDKQLRCHQEKKVKHIFLKFISALMTSVTLWMFVLVGFLPVFVNSSSPTFRTTTYEVIMSRNDFSLVLNQDLAEDYFTIIIGSATGNTTRNADSNFLRVSADPFGTGALSVSPSSNILSLTRTTASDTWIGQVTVIESLGDNSSSGFSLLDVVEVSVSGTGVQSSSASSAVNWSDINQVVPFGGLRGGGVTLPSSANSSDHCYGHGRFFPSGINTINVERNSLGCGSGGQVGTYVVYVVEWGSEWNIQRATVTGNAGGGGADNTSEYNTASINQVVRENTWVWASGYTDDGGIGDSWSGQIATLGNGVNQNTTETLVAVGAEYADNRVVDVYVMEHPEISVDYVFKPDGDTSNLIYDYTVDSGVDTYNSTSNGTLVGIASVATVNGADGYWPVLYGATPISSTIDLVALEDTISDAERNHTSETVSYLVFSGQSAGGVLLDNSLNIIGEYGSVVGVSDVPITVNFSQSLDNPVVFLLGSMVDSTELSAVTRLNNITSSGFNLFLQPANSLGSVDTSVVYWLAVEAGEHTLPGGINLEVGKGSISGLNSTTNWSTSEMLSVTPSLSFVNPVVFSQVQTFNDSGWQASWATGSSLATPPAVGSIYIGRHIAGDNIDTDRLPEDVGYLIIEEGLGVNNGFSFEAGLTNNIVMGVDDTPPYVTSLGFLSFVTDSTVGRFALQYNSSNGTGNAFPRPYWSLRHIGPTTLRATRQYSGQGWVSWVQSIDFGGVSYGVLGATVSSFGSQLASVLPFETDFYVGGGWSVVPTTGDTITSVTISENGTIDASSGLENIKLYYDLDMSAPYDCASETYEGNEVQFGNTDADGFSGSNGTSTFNGNLSINTNSVACFYVVLDTTSFAFPGQELEIEISNPSTDVVLSNATASPATPLSVAGSTIVTGSLSVDIVNQLGASVPDPSFAMSPLSVSLDSQTATGVLGESNQKIRITNDSVSASWVLSLAGDLTTNVWGGTSHSYDFNDSSGAVDGADFDLVGGQMTVDSSVATINPAVGCSSNGLSTGSSASFSEGAVDSIVLVSASALADVSCYWDITGIDLDQLVPAEQPADNYSLSVTITLVSS